MATFTKAKWGSIPSYPLPEGFKDSMSYLRHLVREGARRCFYVRLPSGDIMSRVNRELDAISKGFPDYLLIVHDYMRFARAKPGFMDINNGPICGSLVAYLLGFAKFNPLDRGLRFEHFINPMFASEWIPDINIKMEEPVAIETRRYVAEKYGFDHFAKLGDHGYSFVLCRDKVSDHVPVRIDDDGLPVVECSVREALEANLVKFDLIAEIQHPIEIECLRESNGTPIYHEQVAEMISLMANKPYAWAAWVEKCLATRQLNKCAKFKEEFVEGCLTNDMFRVTFWKEEDAARKYASNLWDGWLKIANRLFLRTHALGGVTTMFYPTARTALGEVNMQDISLALKRGERVSILIRHAERPPLEKNDPTFGKDLEITENGKAKADALAFALFQWCKGCTSQVNTGDSKRCEMTGLIFSERSGELGYRRVKIAGSKCPYFGDVSERLALANEGHYFDALNEYFKSGRQRGFNDLAEATDRVEKELWEGDRYNPHQLNIFVTHDICVGCFLAGRKVITHFDESNWPKFLDAAVAFLGRNGRARYGYMRCYDNKYTFDC